MSTRTWCAEGTALTFGLLEAASSKLFTNCRDIAFVQRDVGIPRRYRTQAVLYPRDV